MQEDYEYDVTEGIEYPPSDRDSKKPSPAIQSTKPNTIMKPTISRANKSVKPPKSLKENQSKPMNLIKKETPPQVHISLKSYVKTSPQANKTVPFFNFNQSSSNFTNTPPLPSEYKELQQLYQNLLYKTNKLEESLRNETITSEEQRSYIEILKQALEEKLITNNLLWPNESTVKSQTPVDFYLESMRLKKVLELKEVEISEIEENKEKNIKEFENNLDKLNEEKEALLEYLDELKNNFQSIEQQNQQYESLISSISNERDELKTYLDELKPEFDLKIEENAKIIEELQSEKALAQEIEEHRQKLLEKNEDLENSLETLKKEFSHEKNNFIEKLRVSNENFSTVKTTLQETQQDLEKSFEKSSFLTEELKKAKENELNHNELESKYLALKEEYDSLSQIKQNEINRIDNDRQRKMEEIKGIYQQLSQNRSEIRVLKEENSVLENEKNGYLQEIEGFSLQNEQFKGRMSNYEAEIQEYKRILADRDLNSAKLHTLTIKYQAEKEFYEDSLKELKRKNNEIIEKAQNFEKTKNQSLSMEQAFKYVNSMIMDLKRHLGNTKLTRNNEKFDLESCLLELHELIIMCLEKFDEFNDSFSKKQLIEKKNEEIRLLQEKLESFEANFDRNFEVFEKEKEEITMKFEYEIKELKKEEEFRLTALENDSIFEKEEINRLKKEKACFEYLLKKFKGVLFEEEGKRLFEDLILVNFEILEQEMKKTELQVKLDQLNQLKMKDNYYDSTNLKENLYENQKILERFYEKKKNLEVELQKIELIDKKTKNEEISNNYKSKKMMKTNSETNLRAIFEETRGTDNSLISNRNYESKLSSIKDEKIANKPQIYRDFSSSKYVSYQDRGGLYEKTKEFGLEANPIYNNLNEARSKFAKKPWKVGNLSYYDQ